jgi:DtxR family Mn-dependent transcriptional regulator
MEITLTEENYLKTIFKSSNNNFEIVKTNTLAEILDTKASSVTDMIKKLSDKNLIHYEKYQGVSLTKKGKEIALQIIRKHRLWEVFLVEKLDFKWDEVHEIAEYLEHVDSNILFDRMEKYLGYPKFDPHGDPIPDKNGDFVSHQEFCLSDMKVGTKGTIVGIKQHDDSFLKYLDSLNMKVGIEILVIEKIDFENSFKIKISNEEKIVSGNVASKIYISKSK